MKEFFDDVFYTLYLWGSKGATYGRHEDTAVTLFMMTLAVNTLSLTGFIVGVLDLNKNQDLRVVLDDFIFHIIGVAIILYIFAYRYFIVSKRYEKIISERERLGYLKNALIYFALSIVAFVAMGFVIVN